MPGFVHLRGPHPPPPLPRARLLVGTRIRWRRDGDDYVTGTVMRAGADEPHRVLDDGGSPHELDLDSLQFELLRCSDSSATPSWAGDIESYWRTRLGDTPESRRVVQTMVRALADSSRSNYCGKIAEFERVCRARDLVPRPASQFTILIWLQYLSDKGTVQASSSQPYLSAINKFHVDVGLPAPAVGQFVIDFVKGWGRRQREDLAADLSDVRVFLPADVVVRVLTLAQRGPTVLGPSLYRAAVFVVLNFVLFARGATGVGLQVPHVILARGELRIILGAEKGREHRRVRRHVGIPREAVSGLYDLISDYANWSQSLWGTTRPPHFWRIPTDGDGRLAASRADDWLQQVLDHLNEKAPPGLKWTGHSMRGGAATSASAIDVRQNKVCFFGGWAAMSAALEKKYIDPTAPATPGCYALFSWMLPAPRASEGA